MTLKQYFEKHKIKNHAEWAKKHGFSPSSIWVWLQGVCTPTLGNMLRLEAATEDQVQIEDWVKKARRR